MINKCSTGDSETTVEFVVPNPLPLRRELCKKAISTLMHPHSMGQRHSESNATKKEPELK